MGAGLLVGPAVAGRQLAEGPACQRAACPGRQHAEILAAMLVAARVAPATTQARAAEVTLTDF